MTAVVMLYAVVVGAVLIPAALFADRAAAMLRVPRRWVWAGALVGVLVLPAVAAWRASDPTSSSILEVGDGQSSVGALGASVRVGVATVAASAASRESWFVMAWTSSSGVAVILLGFGVMALDRRRRSWGRSHVLGRDIRLAPDTGPAVVGLRRPEVVLPVWALRLGADDLDVVLRHEEEHLRAGDQWLVHAAAVAIAAMPWNPIVWWCVARLRLAIEFDCDRRLLARESHDASFVSRYGELLLSVPVRRSSVFPLATSTLIESSSTLARRISAMCPQTVRFPRTTVLASICGAALCLVAACSTPLPTGASDGAPAANELSFDSPGLVRPGPGVTNPRLLRSSKPTYTPAAMRAGIQGSVELEAIVRMDGTVGDVRVLRSLDSEHGLDEEAVKAARTWRFRPALIDGDPVTFAVVLEMSFTLH